MRAVLVLNGEPPSPDRLRELAETCPVYAADGGARICLDAGIRPEWVAGDLDSLHDMTLPEDWTVKPFPEQDRSDFQKVLATLPKKVEEVLILGGLGRRLDHTFSNLLIAAEQCDTLRMAFEGENERMIRITPDCPFAGDPGAEATVSLLPLGFVEGVTTKGLKWELTSARMGPGVQLGQSNLAVTDRVTVTVARGTLFLWMRKRPI